MLVVTLIAFALIIGVQIGWYAHQIRKLLMSISQLSKRSEDKAPSPQKNQSGVIVQGQVRQKGAIIDLPDIRPESSVIRRRTPEQVKRDGDKYIDQLIEEQKR